MRHSSQITVIVALTATLTIAGSVTAQTTTGSLRGIVTDPDGLAMPGVTVVATLDKLVAGTQGAVTGATDVYRCLSLLPGP